jgi:hypothetical protein
MLQGLRAMTKRRTLTAGEIAERIRESDDEYLRVVFERLRHWTRSGLLKPTGEQNPGTGHHLRFPQRALADAAILTRLTKRYGLWAKKMPLFTSALLDQAAKQIPKMADHIKNRRIAYLVCGTIDGKFLANVQEVAEPSVTNPEQRYRLMLSPLMDDVILINLNRLFAQLHVPLEEI